MSGKKFRVVCYCRVATRDQNDDSPLETQSVYLRRYAKDNGLKVIGEVRAYEKGTHDGPARLVQCIEPRHQGKGRCHFVMELGRVARNPWMVMETLRELSEQGLMVFASDYSLSCNTSLANKIKQASIAIHQI